MMGFLTKFLASKSITIVLLLSIMGMGTLYFFTYKELQQANSKIKKDQQTISDKNSVIAGYKSKVNFLQDNIKSKDLLVEKYAKKVKELNKDYKDVKKRLDDVKLINRALRTKINKINTEQIPDNNTEAIRKVNEMLNTYIFN